MPLTISLSVAACLLVLFLLALRLRTNKPRLTLSWSDEFDGARGSAPDPAKWTCELGGGGWGNNELETYTDRPENVFLDGCGNLVITARRETFTGPDGITRDYTSARLVTKGKFAQAYGRFEARIKLPNGIWPAFWLLGDNIDAVGWPDCREADVMENIGREPGINHGSLHGPGFSGGNSLTGAYSLPDGEKLSDDFHVYLIDWEPGSISFSVDGHVYFTSTPADVPGKSWGFDRPMFILLNVAVGGNWPGSPDATTSFPQVMLVDYVRAYTRSTR